MDPKHSDIENILTLWSIILILTAYFWCWYQPPACWCRCREGRIFFWHAQSCSCSDSHPHLLQMHIPHHSQTSKINSSREHELAIYTIHNKNLRVYSVFCTPLNLFCPRLYQCYRSSPYPTSSAPAASPSSPCPTGPAPPPCLPAPGGRVSQFLHHCSGSSLCPRCWSSFSIVRL